MFQISIIAAIAGLVFYQLSMKTAPTGANPLLLLMMAYLIAAVVCGVGAVAWWRLTPAATVAMPLSTAMKIGGSIVLIEVGFILAYRYGGGLGHAVTLAQVSSLVILLIVGVVAFKEPLTPTRLAGLAACVTGVLLLGLGAAKP